MGTGVFRLVRCMTALSASLLAVACLSGTALAAPEGVQGCPGSGFPYLNEYRLPVAPEGFADDCRASIFDASLDVRTGVPDIAVEIGDGIVVDSHGRLTHLSVAAGPRFDLSRPAGVVASVSDSNGHDWTLSYDSAGRIAKTVGPSGTSSYSYDAAGDLIHMSFGASESETFSYDSARRLSTFGDSGGDTATFTYDAAGHLSSLQAVITETDPTQSFTYDGAGNVLSWTLTGGITETLTYTHDSAGDVTTVKRGTLTDATLSYDTAHRLSSVADGSSTTIASYTYDSSSRLTAAAGNHPGQTDTFAYDSAGRLASVTAGTTTSSLTYDSLGRVAGVQTAANPTVSITYLPAPIAATGGSSQVGAKRATVRGTVDPLGAPTGDRFEFGTTTSYGHATSLQTVASGSTAISVQATLTGLKPNTTYHYRIDAANRNGSAAGGDRTFRTAPVRCIVPHLAGDSLKAARRALAKGHCRLGKVTRPHHVAPHTRLKVKSQRPPGGSVRPAGTKVSVRLVVA